MPVDTSLVGREFPPTRPYAVSEERIGAFVAATGGAYDGGPAPATFPIVLAFDAMNAFLEAEEIDLFRIVPGDVLPATLTVASLRQIAGNDIIGTTSRVTDADGALVCSTSATLVHRGAPA